MSTTSGYASAPLKVLKKNPCEGQAGPCKIVELALIRATADQRDTAYAALLDQAKQEGAEAIVLLGWTKQTTVNHVFVDHMEQEELNTAATRSILYAVAIRYEARRGDRSFPGPQLLVLNAPCQVLPIKKLEVRSRDAGEALTRLKSQGRRLRADALVITGWWRLVSSELEDRGVSQSARISVSETISAMAVRYLCADRKR